MKKSKPIIILKDQKNDFFYEKSKSNLVISFNRISFIFFIFFIISVIFSIHLIHLGSRESNKIINSNLQIPSHKLYRTDIVDRNGKYLVKTVNSIDVGINSKKLSIKKN